MKNSNDHKNFIISINIITGIYSDIIKFFGKDSIYLLHKCFLTNRLDEFIHKWYSYKSSKYYDEFKDKNIKIGKTNLLAIFDNNNNLLDENNEIIIEKFEIYDNDHCPCCNTKGFFTNKLGSIINSCPDCIHCYKYICKKCSKIPNIEEPYLRECYKCGGFELKNDI
jgi:hypothetical protein